MVIYEVTATFKFKLKEKKKKNKINFFWNPTTSGMIVCESYLSIYLYGHIEI